MDRRSNSDLRHSLHCHGHDHQVELCWEVFKSIKTMIIQQEAREATLLYVVGGDGVVKIDWEAVETADIVADRISPLRLIMFRAIV